MTSAVPAEVLRARNAVYAVFALNGFLMASWVARIPGARATLDLSPGRLGLLLLCLAAGSAVALPVAGQIVLKIGARGAMRVFAAVCSGGAMIAGAGVSAKLPLLAAAGLFVYGLGTSIWDVAMNVEGAAVEQGLRRSIMPRFHAAWSLGGVGGAGIGAVFAALDVPLVVHLTLAGAAALVAAEAATHWFLRADPHGEHAGAPPRAALIAWTERRTLLIGLVTLCAALVEGVANDWYGLTLVDGYHQRQYFGAIGFGVFVTLMTVGRAMGTVLIDRFGRVTTLRLSALSAATGITLVVVGPWLPVALLGGVLWGAGAALGFPMGMSAAADDPVWAAPRLGVVTSIGYLAFLAGPPLVGFVADEVGIRRAVSVVLVALLLMAVLAPVERPLSAPERAEAAAPGEASGSGAGAFTS
ncbi:MAG: MFS transporter [Actinomycetales bacterium]